MFISSNLVARLRIGNIRDDRVNRRIACLSEAARNTPSPVTSVFRRNETAGRTALDVGPIRRLGRKSARTLQTPTAGMWAPAA